MEWNASRLHYSYSVGSAVSHLLLTGTNLHSRQKRYLTRHPPPSFFVVCTPIFPAHPSHGQGSPGSGPSLRVRQSLVSSSLNCFPSESIRRPWFLSVPEQRQPPASLLSHVALIVAVRRTQRSNDPTQARIGWRRESHC